MSMPGRNLDIVALVSDIGTGLFSDWLKIILETLIPFEANALYAVRVWLIVPKYVPATRIVGIFRLDIQSSTVCSASNGTIVPPTPSMRVTISLEVFVLIEVLQNSTSWPKLMLRPSRDAAISGDKAALKRQGEIWQTFAWEISRPMLFNKIPESVESIEHSS